MALLNIRKNPQQPQQSRAITTPTTWDPFREMRELMNLEPWGEIETVTFTPAFEVKENGNAYVFKADMPGLKEQDVDVQLNGDRLTISGQREAEKEDKNDTYYTYERSYGSFSRTFTLPGDVNAQDAKAELKDGVFTLVLPKSGESQAKKIPVKSAEKVKA